MSTLHTPLHRQLQRTLAEACEKVPNARRCSALLADPDAGYEDGLFVFLHPMDNQRCRDAVTAYRRMCSRSFGAGWVYGEMSYIACVRPT